MDLKKRLAQLDRLTRKPAANSAQPSPKSSENRQDIDVVLSQLGLVKHETTQGPVWRADYVDLVPAPLSPLSDLTGLFSRQAQLVPGVKDVLFLDTETTGLAGGTGTLIFQLGVSWWQDDGLHTRQYFLPGPAHEAAMLVALAELAQPFSVVVTFNGASFDLPLLRTRALLNRLPDPMLGLVSWDLLVPGRRLWNTRLPNCRQQTLEQLLHGRQRESGDIDGAQIPQTWFDFLSTGEPGLLRNVLTHNHRDMLGMASIFDQVCQVGSWLNEAGSEPWVWPACGSWADRAGGWALGRILEQRQDREGAARCFARAWRFSWGVVEDPAARWRFRRDAVRNLKRCGEWDLVEKVVLDGLESGEVDSAWHREAAILYEHRLVDLSRALHHALLVGDGHRTARLQRLLAR